MATNRELKAEALALGKQLGVEVDVERKNNAQLTELVEGLRARALAAEEPEAGEVAEQAPASEPPVTSAPAAEEAAPAPPAALQATPKPPVYQIAPGKALTSLRGILGPGERVSARDFAGGQPNLDELVAKGHVVKS